MLKQYQRPKSLIKVAEVDPLVFLAGVKNLVSKIDIPLGQLNQSKVNYYRNKKMTVKTDCGSFVTKCVSLRYLCFLRSLVCSRCGIKGNVIFLEKYPNDTYPHANLYHRSSNGTLTLLTKDHIHPKSQGGLDRMDNLQTMCIVCNGLKADSLI